MVFSTRKKKSVLTLSNSLALENKIRIADVVTILGY